MTREQDCKSELESSMATADSGPPPQQPPLQSQPPKMSHQDDADEEDDSVKQLGDCSVLYLSLQNCLIKTDRNWKSCQTEVQDLKGCNERRMKGNKKD